MKELKPPLLQMNSTTLCVVSQQGPGYVFDTTSAHERERLAANERYWDPFSIRILEQFGIAEGMRYSTSARAAARSLSGSLGA